MLCSCTYISSNFFRCSFLWELSVVYWDKNKTLLFHLHIKKDVLVVSHLIQALGWPAIYMTSCVDGRRLREDSIRCSSVNREDSGGGAGALILAKKRQIFRFSFTIVLFIFGCSLLIHLSWKVCACKFMFRSLVRKMHYSGRSHLMIFLWSAEVSSTQCVIYIRFPFGHHVMRKKKKYLLELSLA